jgi:hypothetical protein
MARAARRELAGQVPGERVDGRVRVEQRRGKRSTEQRFEIACDPDRVDGTDAQLREGVHRVDFFDGNVEP